MNWYVGQKVVCVDASPAPCGAPVDLQVGASYVIAKVATWGDKIMPEGVAPPTMYTWFHARRFRPIDPLTEQLERIESEGAPLELEVA